MGQNESSMGPFLSGVQQRKFREKNRAIINDSIYLYCSGKEFVEQRTSSCEYHFNESVKKHAKEVTDTDRYYQLIDDMKNSSTELRYLSKKEEFDTFIKTIKSASCRKSLDAFINFWNERNFRWVLAYRKQSNCGIPRNSLAEAAHAKMKSGGRKNLSLVDAAYADTEASACFEACWQKRKDGERSTGNGPTGMNIQYRLKVLAGAWPTIFTYM